MTPQHLKALARADEVRLAASARRRQIATLPTAEGAEALADAIEAGDLAAIPVERALTAIRKVGERKARGMMRAADIVGNPRLRDVSPKRREALVFLLRGWGS